MDLKATALLMLVLVAAATAQNYQLNEPAKEPNYEPKLVCYYSNWAVYRPGLAKFTPENINPYLCTHIIYAFASLSEEFELQPFDPYNDVEQGNYRSFVNLKSYNPSLKTLVAVGGWNEGSRRFSRLVESEDSRRKFVGSALAFLREHGFDGLDLDWEYPAFREGGNQTTDKKGYAMLIKELRHAIENERTPKSKDKLLLTVAVPATKDYIDGGFDVPEISKHADFLNVLTYDYHSAYEPEARHHAPLFALERQDDANRLNVAWTVSYYLSQGAPARKLVVGIPLYGRSYTLTIPQLANGYGAPADAPGDEGTATREKGYLAYYEICQKVKDDDWEVEAPTPELVGPYAHKGKQWVGFDDEEMLLNKARYILDNGLGGAMIWTLDNDDFRGLCTGEPSPLVGTVRDVLIGSNLIAGSSSRRSVARSAPEERSSDTVLRFDDEEVAEPPRRRNTLRRLVQNRQASRNRQAAGRRINTSADDNSLAAPHTTPAPPPTPDPGVVAFECSDEGFFNNPRDCRKYFWCLDSGPANLGVVAHAFTCPSGLHFNSGTESCDYPENVVCPVGSAGAKPTTRPRARTTKATTTSTTTTTTEPPTTTTEEPTPAEEAAPEGGENVAELLRLLQAIGGVERLQSLLGAQDKKELAQYDRTTQEPTTSRRPDASPYLDPYDYVRPTTDDDLEDEDGITPGVDYVKDTEEDSYEAPLRTTTGPYRTPIRVQVGRVVRVQNGTVGGDSGRRRMLVRVRIADEGPGPTAGGDERSLSGSTLLATRANPIGGGGETRVAVRRRPVYNEKTPEEPHGAAQGQGVRLVARRPDGNGERGNYVTIRRRPTTSQSTTTTAAPRLESHDNSTTDEYDDEYDEYEDYEDDELTTTTTTTTKRPSLRPVSEAPKTTTAASGTFSSRSSSRRGSAPSSTTTARPSPSQTGDDEGPPVEVLSDSEIVCNRRGVFIHPSECSKFIVCAPVSRNAEQGLKGRVLNCPANQIYLVDIGRCMKGDRNQCQKL